MRTLHPNAMRLGWLPPAVVALAWGILAGAVPAQQTAAAPAGRPAGAGTVVEEGRFRLHKFEQPIGEERYQIARDGPRLQLTSTFEFKDRGTSVPLAASVTVAGDLTPEEFDVKGRTSRATAVDDSVVVHGGLVHVREGQAVRDVAKPDRFFTIAGYAPTAMQMMLVRYWLGHGSPERLTIFPAGEVRIKHRGRDQVEIQGHTTTLERYIISGLIWGRETVWLDSQRALVGVVTVDAEFDHFEAIREGFEDALPVLVRTAGIDEMAVLADMARQFPGRRTGKLALVGGTLVDGTGRAPVPDAAVVIDGDRIVAAGPRAQVTIPSDAKVVDTRGKTILPGLWDMHAHFEQVEWGPVYLAAGVTTARDCANEFEFITAARDAIRDGRGLGPRLLMAGVVDGTGPLAVGVQRVDNAQEAQDWVSRYHDAHFQQIKIYSSMKEPNVEAVAADAHKLGMTVTGHVPEGMNVFQAVQAGMDQINHVHYIADVMVPDGALPDKPTRQQRLEALAAIDVSSPKATQAIEFLKQHGTVVDPTVALMEASFASPAYPFESFEPGVRRVAPELAPQFVTPAARPGTMDQTMHTIVQRYLQIVGALHKAGVPIVAGTDQTVPGFSLYREIELYVQAGFTPLEAIQAATLVPATVMGLDKELGTVEAGKKADVIVLGRNPLETISNIRTVEKVVAGGTMYDAPPLWESVGFKPTP